ncbi:thioredoxin family protein [Echinicola marina]|uniref:thioredoxin family protein n=1 Tax=Echinicola marina TaxID=2859768 RepID=UPI001CF6B002|nr:thioredoxin family protein [Echinicola marina]UCS91785.1 thioredoxin family protein [Echinicola marina]
MQHIKVLILAFIFTFQCSYSHAQEASIHWISFEQLEDALELKPKKVFIDFYTDWCSYCKKMDKKVFTKAEVIEKINKEYYAVKMDAETQDSIRFDGQVFINRQSSTRRPGIHDLALLLANRNGQFAPPSMLIMSPEFKILDRRFEYLYSEQLLEWLNRF